MSNRRVDEDKRATLRRFAALGAATPLVGLGGGDDGEDDSSGSSDARDAIVGYVASTPGAHFSKVRDDLQLGTGETQYHLRNLVDDDTLEVSRDGDYKRFFPAGRFSEFEQVTLGYLRRDTPRGMLVHLLRDPAATGSELAARLGVSRATVSTYAKELDAVGLLSREDGYAVRNPETVITLLIRYADSFGSDAAAFADDAAELIRFDP
ncbi:MULTISPECIES: winged helix-turn-helix transcriptional regulator [Haloferax]|jgi:predicted transcriptional regulator|uniref:MarR family transcriptional regulator n=4 Tax=Haloferax TaxID=2251 RepID=A0A6C0US32_HALVO|nr:MULTISPECIES: MarR family transcriptional regulator [Haloferax]ELZ72483.1 transcriptional regulator [Haloferax lucentense DSM 14919]ELZ92332.1 transcriptional regulator [Haloferax alexandrinus JCM 10717]MBC9985588.1 MarR family transcriptional regulator [Haloferax sp. AS1]NLV01739.1 MarR family transcriptional regulator [Haloferax alexandrinus]QIB77353.1 MarR family transcriptional regulator [Haloferax alexandrinus]